MIILKGGYAYSGGSAFYYTGTYQRVGNGLIADIDVVIHRPGMPSVFGGDDTEYKVLLTGDLQDNGLSRSDDGARGCARERDCSDADPKKGFEQLALRLNTLI